MKILLINKDFSSECGGTGKYIWNTGNLLQSKGHQVYYFANNRKPLFIENYEYEKFFPKYIDLRNLTNLEKIRYFYKPFYNFEAEKNLSAYLKEIKPDIIHCNCLHYNISPSVLNACYKSKIPTIMTIHESSKICPNGVLMYKGEEYCKQGYCISGNPLHCAINRCSNKDLFKSSIATLEYLFRKTHRLYDRVPLMITPSVTLKNLIVKSGVNSSK
ncbi:MAG: glycosyltransferase, partial [Candidatus Gastranaerophilales bacterium]|nr:glycosyltransferase [Candidatus Gastranaerophilales bacterium]